MVDIAVCSVPSAVFQRSGFGRRVRCAPRVDAVEELDGARVQG